MIYRWTYDFYPQLQYEHLMYVSLDFNLNVDVIQHEIPCIWTLFLAEKNQTGDFQWIEIISSNSAFANT